MSSYVKALEGVMRLFPKKISVTFIHVSGYQIGICKLYEEQLPRKFKRPIIIKAFEKKWRVLKADPLENKDFVYSRKLELVVVEPELAGKLVPEYFTATVVGSMPEVVPSSDYSDFEVEILEEEWRQVELLPASYLPVVNEEIAVIENLLRPGNGANMLRGYEKRYIRNKIAPQSLNICLNEFCKEVESSKLGNLRFNESYVKNGFVLKSAGFTYYGTVEGNFIKNLCVYKFDCADFELFTVLSSFDLLMAHWCKAKIFTAEVSETNEVREESPGSDPANFI